MIAQVSEVKKVTWVLEAEGEITDTDPDGYPTISVTLNPDRLSDVFIIRGTCSALLYLSDERLSLYELKKLLGIP